MHKHAHFAKVEQLHTLPVSPKVCCRWHCSNTQEVSIFGLRKEMKQAQFGGRGVPSCRWEEFRALHPLQQGIAQDRDSCDHTGKGSRSDGLIITMVTVAVAL